MGCYSDERAFSRYDVADYLRAPGDMAATIAAALRDIARTHGMARLAKETGLTREGLYKTLSKDGSPSFGSILKAIHALRLKLKPVAG